MRYLKKFYESSESKIEEIQNHLIEISKDKNILERCTIRKDGTVDVNGNFEVFDVTKLPVKFGYVSGDFKFSSSTRSFDLHKLTTLEGSPISCRGFDCSFTRITSLVGSPYKVDQIFNCSNTLITNLVGSPEFVNWLQFHSTPVTSLEGSPTSVGYAFEGISVHNLTNLVGGPKSVGSRMKIHSRNICSFEGAPNNVRTLDVSSNRGNLKDPRGLEDVNVEELEVSLNGIDPISKLCNLFLRHGRGDQRLGVSEIPKATTQKFMDSLDYGYVKGPKGNPYIDLFRLREALGEFDIETPYFFQKGSFIANQHNPNGLRTLPGYDFVDEEGRVVDFDGNPI